MSSENIIHARGALSRTMNYVYSYKLPGVRVELLKPAC